VEAILGAAARLLVETGYRSASTNAIARRAGVSIGSLYQFFESREDIFRTLLDRHTCEVHACAARALEPVLEGRVTASAVLPKLLRDLLALHQDHPALAHAMTTELAHLDTEAHRRKEAREMDALVQCVAARLPGPRRKALAKAWMVSEITAHLTCRLAHEPPEDVAMGDILAVFKELVRKLLA
jgi:AcrR family transcriptional regulator